MIVCSCNIITRKEIEEAVNGILDEDAWQLVTVGMVYHAMAKRGKCCGCFPIAISVIVETIENWHRRNDTPDEDFLPFLSRTRDMLERQDGMRRLLRSGRRAA